MLSGVICIPPVRQISKVSQRRRRWKERHGKGDTIRTRRIMRVQRVQDMTNNAIGTEQRGNSFIPSEKINFTSKNRNMSDRRQRLNSRQLRRRNIIYVLHRYRRRNTVMRELRMKVEVFKIIPLWRKRRVNKRRGNKCM